MVYGYLTKMLRLTGEKIPLRLDIQTHPHLLMTGASGTGKSMSILYLLGKLLQSHPDIVVYFCDFKNSEDFSFLSGYEHYYAGEQCYKGITDYYKQFTEARESRDRSKRYILIFDEYPAFVSYLQGKDKMNKTKQANEVLSIIAETLMLGRGIGFYVWILVQRADATLFASGARDNFMVLAALGRLSKEQKGMIFPGEEIPERVFGVGEGLVLADGLPLMEIKYPIINDVDDWKRHIRNILLPGGVA